MTQDLPDTYRHPLPNGLYYDMVRVRPGLFVMGSKGEEEEFKGDELEHLVHITRDYYIGVYPVTQSIWDKVMNGHPSWFYGDDLPVEQVSWQDIVEGGQDSWQDILEGRKEEDAPEGFLSHLNTPYTITENGLKGFEFRLPTEAEWEYAAKGGHKIALSPERVQSFLTTDQPRAADLYTAYAGSDLLNKVGWYDENSNGELKAVGKQAPNELGLYDMTGNVHEWCQDWYDSHFYAKCKEQGIVQDPLNKEEGRYRVFRGGSWDLDADYCHVAHRNYWYPTTRCEGLGFRLVLAPVQR